MVIGFIVLEIWGFNFHNFVRGLEKMWQNSKNHMDFGVVENRGKGWEQMWKNRRNDMIWILASLKTGEKG